MPSRRALRIFVSDEFGQGVDDVGLGGGRIDAEGGERSIIFRGEEGENEVFGADVVVSEAQGFAVGELEGFAGVDVERDEGGQVVGGVW